MKEIGENRTEKAKNHQKNENLNSNFTKINLKMRPNYNTAILQRSYSGKIYAIAYSKTLWSS